MTISIGTKVNILPEQTSGHRLRVGTVGEVVGGSTEDWEVRGEPAVGDGGPIVQWLTNDEMTVVEAETLESFKALVVEKAQAAAKVHGWCNEVSRVLTDLGLGDLISRERTVILSYAVVIQQAPGESEQDLKYRALDGMEMSKRDDSAGKNILNWWTQDYIVKPLD